MTAMRRRLLWVSIALKVALLGLLMAAVAFPDPARFEGKAMTARAIVYPLAVTVVPVVWWLLSRRRPVPYPYALDILWTLPFVVDTVSNALDLYDTVGWWDDATHLVNWVILVLAFGQLLLRLPVGRLATAGLCVGFGAVIAILWELAEYATFIRDSPELETAYTDTLGDLALGLGGSIVAAAITAGFLWPRAPTRARA
jgi:hypothetical protein